LFTSKMDDNTEEIEEIFLSPQEAEPQIDYVAEIRGMFPTHGIPDLKKKIAEYRQLCHITPLQQMDLIRELQHYYSSIQQQANYKVMNQEVESKIITRQERTIQTGNSNLSVHKNYQQSTALDNSLERAMLFFKRRLIDPVDVFDTLTNQLKSPNIPYTLTGLTSSTIITGIFTSQVRMRPSTIELMKSIIKDDDLMAVDELKKTVTLKPFKKVIATMSFVQKKKFHILYRAGFMFV